MIIARNISHYYDTDLALKKTSLHINQGEFIAFIGESGSGKSTLLSILSTLLTPTKGDVFLLGQNIQEITNIDTFRKENIGFIFQFHYLIDYLNVKENIKIADASISDIMVHNLTKRLGIEQLLEKYPSELSGGQRQRVAIVRALINKPKVIFADEPTGNLDSKNACIVFELFKQLSKEGTTIIVTTHNKQLAAFANTIYEVSDGEL